MKFKKTALRNMTILLSVLMVFTLMFPCGQVQASGDEITVNIRIEGYQDGALSEGTILPTLQLDLPSGSTARDALDQAVYDQDLALVESDGIVSSIAGQTNCDFGGWDGWMYLVNGYSPNVGADSYILQDGDTVLWYYGDFGTKYPDFIGLDRDENGFLNLNLFNNSSAITGANVTVSGSVYASVYSDVYDDSDGLYTVVFADNYGNLLPPGEYALIAEKFSENGLPEMVKTEPVVISVVDREPNAPEQPAINSAAPKGSQGIEVCGTANPGNQVVVEAVYSDSLVKAKPVFADASGKFKAYLDIAEEGTYSLTATATKPEVKVETNGTISEGSLPVTKSSPFNLIVVQKPEIAKVEYNYKTNAIDITVERSSSDNAEIQVTLSSWGQEDRIKTIKSSAETTSYKVSFANIYDTDAWWTVTAKAVTASSESIEGVWSGPLDINRSLLLLKDKAVNIIKNSYEEKGAGKSEYTDVCPYTFYLLQQADADTSGWVYQDTTLKDAITDIVYANIDSGETSAKRLAYDLLAMKELGNNDLVNQILDVLQERHSEKGFDNSTYSDFPAYDVLGQAGYLDQISFDCAKSYILSCQNKSDTDYGSWGYIWDGSYCPDFMTTAQAVRALSYLSAGEDQEIKAAIEAGLKWMQEQQQSDGSFKTGYDDSLIDTVETIVTLSALDISPSSWKNDEKEKSPVDYMFNGAFNYPEDSFGDSANLMNAAWALNAYIFLEGENDLPEITFPVVVDPSNASVNIDGTCQFTAKLSYYDGSTKDVTAVAEWAVADSSIAGINNNKGLIRGLKAGETNVTATYNGVIGTAVLTVKSSSSGSGSSPDTCSVGVAVVGSDGEVLYGPSYVDVSENNEWGLTALGALDATRIDYEMSEKSKGFVGSICGVENEGMSGWMYTVNGNSPAVAASLYDIDSGDKVIWYYSESMDQKPPKWGDLEDSAGTGSTAKDLDKVLEEIADGDYEAGEAVEAIFNSVNQMKETDLTDEVKKQLEEAMQKTVQLIEKLPADALEIKAEGSKTTVKVDEDLLDSQIAAVKKAAELAKELKKLGITGPDGLAQNNVVIELPLADGANNQTIELEAATARKVAESSLGLSLKNSLMGVSFPCETVNTLLDATEKVTKLELATQKLTDNQLNIFSGAEPIGDKSFDIKISAVTADGSKIQPDKNFAKKVSIAIPLDGLDLTAVNKDRLAIYRQNEDGSWEYVGGRLSNDGKSFIFETEHLSIYSLLEYKRTFSDINGHWAQDVIEEMAMKMITTGMGDGSFAPDKQLTRAEFAAFLVRALGLEKTASSSVIFSDVAPQYWGRQAIATAYQAGLVLGTSNGKFQPERTITREEMAVMIVRALQKSGVEATIAEEKLEETFASYTDAKEVSAWAQEALAVAINSGIVKGRTAATLEPLGKATRAEALVVIQRMLTCLVKS